MLLDLDNDSVTLPASNKNSLTTTVANQFEFIYAELPDLNKMVR
jgi:hypothetical protein